MRPPVSQDLLPVPKAYQDSVEKAYNEQVDSAARERRRYGDSIRRSRHVSQRFILPERSFAAESLILLAIIGVVSAAGLLWVRMTPEGFTAEDSVQPNETILWQGAPRQGYYADANQLYQVFGGVLWLVLVYFAMGLRLAPLFESRNGFALVSLFLILLGIWQLVGRYFADVRNRRRTTYLLTNMRAFVAVGSSIQEYRIKQIEDVSAIQHRDGTWTLRAAKAPHLFQHIPDGVRVRDLILKELRELKKTVEKKPAP